jgi:hypothetical protein
MSVGAPIRETGGKLRLMHRIRLVPAVGIAKPRQHLD